MSPIGELIAELCPKGISFNPLGHITEIKTGTPINKPYIQQNPGPYPVINSGRDPLGYISSYNTDDSPLGITSRGAGVGSVTWCEGRYHRGPLNYGVTVVDNSRLNVRFLYHLLNSFQVSIHELCTYQGIPALNRSNLEKLRIPVPPLKVQREIVRILDEFTQLEAELEAELEKRRQQYEYYRQRVFMGLRSSDADLVPLAELGTWYGGGTPSKARRDYWNQGDIPWVSPKDMGAPVLTSTIDYVTKEAVLSSSTKLVPRGSVVIVVRSSILNHTLPVSYVPMEVTLNQDMKAVMVHEGLRSKYVYYALAAHSSQILHGVRRTGGSVASLESKKLWQFCIPVPPLEEQDRIVDLLDKFDALVNDLSVGLPAELNARRKQYEYYRDQLLTFKELPA